MASAETQAAGLFDPVNYQKRDCSRIEQDVDYAFQVLSSLQSQLDRCGPSVASWVVEGGSHAASNLRLLEEPPEALASVASDSVDFSYSNAPRSQPELVYRGGGRAV